MEHLAARFAEIPGVEAVVLGGSRATGLAHANSDWDFGLYYRGTLDPADVRALGFEGAVFAPGEWGRIVNGGAWLTIDGQRVDLLYRDLAQVEKWTRDAERGEYKLEREVGFVAGIPTYIAPAELACSRVLVGSLPKPDFPAALRARAPAQWRGLVAGALKFATGHAQRDDATACAGNLAIAALSEAHGRMVERGEWYLFEKGLLERAGLDAVSDALRALDDDLFDAIERVQVLLRR
ncbi:MAG TPA: nucleotidyltransferase domain-containing protein [Acidimicrobiia bacterium]|nr:nucleotidyltransferase domain-containing protein [Acidimicrobiia bacterium]